MCLRGNHRQVLPARRRNKRVRIDFGSTAKLIGHFVRKDIMEVGIGLIVLGAMCLCHGDTNGWNVDTHAFIICGYFFA